MVPEPEQSRHRPDRETEADARAEIPLGRPYPVLGALLGLGTLLAVLALWGRPAEAQLLPAGQDTGGPLPVLPAPGAPTGAANEVAGLLNGAIAGLESRGGAVAGSVAQAGAGALAPVSGGIGSVPGGLGSSLPGPVSLPVALPSVSLPGLAPPGSPTAGRATGGSTSVTGVARAEASGRNLLGAAWPDRGPQALLPVGGLASPPPPRPVGNGFPAAHGAAPATVEVNEAAPHSPDLVARVTGNRPLGPGAARGPPEASFFAPPEVSYPPPVAPD